MTVTAAAAKKLDIQIQWLPIDSLRPDPNNPRKMFKAIEELADNIKANGIKDPLRARPAADKKDEFLIVFGERRWRAAKKVGLTHLPALVEVLSDSQALELMLLELAQRSDVHPVEEAEAYKTLRDVHKLSVAEISARVGRPPGTVYERLKLCELAEPVKKAALAGDLPASHAVLIARIPDKKLQVEALKEMTQWDGVVSYREALRIAHDEYMLQLSDVQWDLTDEKLVPVAGSCAKCPKRTGNQPELFSDVKSKDTCTDPACFKSKKEAFVKLTITKAQAEGKKVLEAMEAEKFFGYSAGRPGAAMIDLDEKDWNDSKHRTWREKLGKKAPTPVLAVDGSAKVHELVPRKEVEKALPKREAPPKRQVSQETQQKHKIDLRRAVVAAALPALIEAARKKPTEAMRFVIGELAWNADVDDVGPLFGMDLSKKSSEASSKAVASVPEKDLVPMAVALNLGEAEGYTWGGSYGNEFTRACGALKVDLKKLEGAERLKRKAAEKAKKATPRVVKVAPKKGKKK